MVCAAVISLIPDILQLRQIPCLIRREPACLLQHGFPHLLTPAGRPAFIDLQRFEQDILLGVHDADEVFQTLPVMIGCVHMDMDAAGAVGLGSCVAYLPDTLLQLGQFRIGELWRYHLHAVSVVTRCTIAAADLLLPVDAGVTHDRPLFAVPIRHTPFIVSAAHIAGVRCKIRGQRCCRLLTGDAGHFNFHAEALVLQPDHAAAPAFSSASTSRMRRAMASMTWTVTLLPACL